MDGAAVAEDVDATGVEADQSKEGGEGVTLMTPCNFEKGRRGERTRVPKGKNKSAEVIRANKATKAKALAEKNAATETKNIFTAKKKAAADKSTTKKAVANVM